MLRKLDSTTPRPVQPSKQVGPEELQDQLLSSLQETAITNSLQGFNPASLSTFQAGQLIKNEQTILTISQAIEIRRQVKEEVDRCRTEGIRKASHKTDEVRKGTDNFVLQHLQGLFKRFFPEEKNLFSRAQRIAAEIFEKKENIDISAWSKEEREQFCDLTKQVDGLKIQWKEAEESAELIHQEVKLYLKEVEKKYGMAIELLRLPPQKEREHIRVLATASQLAGGACATPEERKEAEELGLPVLSLHVRRIIDALKSTNSMDEAIDKVCEDSRVYGGDKVEPSIQKAVSSRTEKKNAWLKSENDNPNIRRIVISIVAEDSFGGQRIEADELLKLYKKEDKQYRVDKIEMVSAPTEEEKERGITFKEKIEDAFKEARLFAEEERKQNPDLEFEGIVHWHGHGTSLTDKINPKDEIICHDEHGTPLTNNIKLEDEISYKEGSLGFLFITRHLYNSGVEGIDKTAIKRIEQENLGKYRYFIHDFHSCCSGAMIA